MKTPLHFGNWQRWLATTILMLLMVTTLAQAADMCCPSVDNTGCRTCVVCASMYSTTPTPSLQPQVRLVAVAAVATSHESSAPSADTFLPLFIRPPPAV